MSDLIEREDAIRAVGEAWGKAYRVIDALKSIPSAERKGKWMQNNLDGTFKIWDCSECGIHMETKWNYCPNCGARMRGTEDGR